MWLCISWIHLTTWLSPLLSPSKVSCCGRFGQALQTDRVQLAPSFSKRTCEKSGKQPVTTGVKQLLGLQQPPLLDDRSQTACASVIAMDL